MLIIVTALAFGHRMNGSGAPARLVQFAIAPNVRTWQFLLAMNILLLVIGSFPRGGRRAAPGDVDPRPGIGATRRQRDEFGIILIHKMEGRVYPLVGLNLCAVDDLRRADRRGHSWHSPVPDHPVGWCGVSSPTGLADLVASNLVFGR